MKVITASGQSVWLHILNDCDENKGGYWVEVYLEEAMDEHWDGFCIHAEDVKTGTEAEAERLAREYVQENYFTEAHDRDKYLVIKSLFALLKRRTGTMIQIGWCGDEPFYATKLRNDTGTAILIHWEFNGDFTKAYVIPENEFYSKGRLYEIIECFEGDKYTNSYFPITMERD